MTDRPLATHAHAAVATPAAQAAAHVATPAAPDHAPDQTLAARVATLEAMFRDIERTRMQGVPILHPGLQVQAIGFRRVADAPAALGVLVTPWFMNLVWLPLDPQSPATRVGDSVTRAVGEHAFAFIGAFEAPVGAYEACSLFSPMDEFVDHPAAVATAWAVLEQLRAAPAVQPRGDAVPVAAVPVAAVPVAAVPVAAVPARRRFLLGRGAPAAGTAP